MTSIELNNEDIWDDRELQRSWDEAFAEYQKYHSIAAKGEDPEDILKQYDLKEMQEKLKTLRGNEGAPPEPDQQQDEILEEEPEVTAKGADAPLDHVDNTAEQPDAKLKHATASTDLPAPTMGLGGPPNISDPNVKQLLMSWYWAGYYTGLYEGRQQATKGNGSD